MKNIIENLDKILESRIRLGVMAILIVNDSVNFNDLKQMLNLTDGNLASHISALEKNKYIKIRKKFVGKKTNTTYTATDTGKKAFKYHLNTLEKLINNKV